MVSGNGEVVRAFSVEHVAKITGLTPRQLAYWDRQGFFRPAYTNAGESVRPLRVYNFRDVVGLRVIAVLLHSHHVSLQHLRRVARELHQISETPWSSLTLGVCKGEVTIIDRMAGQGVGVLSGQYVLVPVIDQVRHVENAAEDLNRRHSGQIGSTERHRNIAHNATVFAGTRIPVRRVEQFLDAGYDVDGVMREFPSLEREDIEAVQTARRRRLAA